MKSHVVSVEEGGKRNVISREKEKFQMVFKGAQPMRKGRAWPESDLEKQFSVLNLRLVVWSRCCH